MMGAELLPSAEPLQLLDADGVLRDDELDVKDDDLVAMYAAMVTTRRVDREAVALQRQGQVGAYPPNLGQEAAQVGSAYALGETDWVFPAYRELGAAIVRGLPPSALVHPFRGTWHGAHDAREYRYALQCLPIATQTLHATGFAMGAVLDDATLAVLTYLGDGATSEGDAHEAMNLASVFGAPVVFFVQNNQYAISVPVRRQLRAPSIAHRGIGYGMPGVLVDGNDVLACYVACRRAVDRARNGDGPTLIEAVTYRLDGHSTADDPTRYRESDEQEQWTRRDPIARMRTFLQAHGLLDDTTQARIDDDAEAAARQLRADIWDAPGPEPAEMFAHVYVTPPSIYAEQAARLAAEVDARRRAEA